MPPSQWKRSAIHLLLLIGCLECLLCPLSCFAAFPSKTVRRKTQKCEYTLVVQEFDPSLCPVLVGHTGHMIRGGGHQLPFMTTTAAATKTTRPPHQMSNPANGTNGGSRSTASEHHGHIFNGIIKDQPKRNAVTAMRESHLTNVLNDMSRKWEELEAKVQSTVSINAQLRSSNDLQNSRIEKLESQSRSADKPTDDRLDELEENLQSLRENLTRIAKEVAELGFQKTYWKSIDDKLAGIMLDMTEVNQVLSRHEKRLEKLGVNEKVIPVEASSDVVMCSVVPDGPTYRDCEDYYAKGHTKSGVYYVIPLYSPCPIPVYCDMDTPPGGWLVIQRRQDGNTDFSRNWTDYRKGFGDVGREFWTGLDNIFLLTNQKNYELRIDLWDFFESRVHATYRKFYIDGERDGYRLHIGNHSGSVADGMQHHDGAVFSTPDHDQDTYPEYHCAKEWGAGWWFANCWFVILNGQYYNHTQVEYRGISWNEWKNEQLKGTEMKIRPSSL